MIQSGQQLKKSKKLTLDEMAKTKKLSRLDSMATIKKAEKVAGIKKLTLDEMALKPAVRDAVAIKPLDETPKSVAFDKFEDAYNFTLKEEGGFYNDPRGGPTYKGIRQSTYDLFRKAQKKPKQDVRRIGPNELEAIYKDYWNQSGADKLPSPLGKAHFDFSFNAGPNQAIKILQKALDIEADGVFGSKTKEALSRADTQKLVEKYNKLRIDFYKSLKDKTHEASWIARAGRSLQGGKE